MIDSHEAENQQDENSEPRSPYIKQNTENTIYCHICTVNNDNSS